MFMRNHKIVSQNVMAAFYVLTGDASYPHQHLVLSVFLPNRPSVYEMVSEWDFHLHFLDD